MIPPADVPEDDMRLVPAGRLSRGSDLSPDEQPQGDVRLSEYYIDVRPVTNADYACFIAANCYARAELWTPTGWAFVQRQQLTQPNYWDDDVWGARQVPVTGVSWWEALAYARWLGKSLPSEAQWEYACRGPDSRTYPWGETEPSLELANYAPGGEPLERRPTEPDAHPANVSPFGCLDMVGNFSEWCLDNYRPAYEAATVDPVVCFSEEETHVVRGGCGLHDEDYLRCSARDHYRPDLRDNLIGFRCVRPVRAIQ